MIKSSVSKQWRGREVKILGKKAMNKSAWEIGLIVEGHAKLLCAVDTGRLAGSITTQAGNQGTQPAAPADFRDVIAPPGFGEAASEVLVGTAVEYGPYVEFGTIKSDAQPFLRPALALAQGKALSIVEWNGKKVFAQYLMEHEAYLTSRGTL